MGEQTPAFDPDLYPHLTPSIIERFQSLLYELDPEWQAKHYGFIIQCLAAIDKFVGRLQEYLEDEHQQLVVDALFLAFRAHGLTLRKSNDALFFEHPLSAAGYLARYKLDAPTLAATLLHDVAEDTTVSISEVVERFGSEVGKLVEGVTKLQATGKEVTSRREQHEANVGTINKLFQFMVDDVRVVLVKLADRRHNMQTLAALPPQKQAEKAREVIQVYAPLAYRLGMWEVKAELEELALKTLHPQLYHRLRRLVSEQVRDQSFWLDIVRETLKSRLVEDGLQARIEPAPEQIYSHFRDFQRHDRLPERLSDIIRVAVLVKTQSECYQSLCVVHSQWSPVPGTFDDYIAQPRENLYQALHTTVFGPGGRLLKVRIRTEEMHDIAHHGILARWSHDISDQYKGFEGIQRLMKRLRPVRGIAEQRSQSVAFREALTDQIQVFTPEGELIELPVGSTPLDFAYQIHTKLGDEARSAYINGVQRALNTVLKNGDQVSIHRVKGGLPLREWLDEDLGFVQTMYARSKIRLAFRRLAGPGAVSIGWEALQREMELMGLSEFDLGAISNELEYESVEHLLSAVACAEIMPYQVTQLALRPIWNALKATPVGGFIVSPDGSVTVRGIPGRPMRMCGFCKPIPGDPIVGNILRGGQVTVHRMDCHHVTPAADSESHLNLVPVEWEQEPRTVRKVHIWVAAVDRSGLAYGLAEILGMEQINMRELYGRSVPEQQVGLLTVTAEVSDLRQLFRILHRIAQMPDVKAVQRVSDPIHCQEDAGEWAVKKVAGS